MITPEAAGIGPVCWQDQAVLIQQKTASRLACDAGFGVVVAGDFARLRGVCDVAEGERAKGWFGLVAAAKGEGARIVVAHHPCPVSARHQLREPEAICVG